MASRILKLGPCLWAYYSSSHSKAKKKKKKSNPGTKKLIFKFWKLCLLNSLLSALDLSFLICHMGIMLHYRFILRVSEIINVATLRTLEHGQSKHQCLGTISQSCNITGTPTCITCISRKRSFQKWSVVKRIWWALFSLILVSRFFLIQFGLHELGRHITLLVLIELAVSCVRAIPLTLVFLIVLDKVTAMLPSTLMKRAALSPIKRTSYAKLDQFIILSPTQS